MERPHRHLRVVPDPEPLASDLMRAILIEPKGLTAMQRQKRKARMLQLGLAVERQKREAGL